ncbi:MAG: hypothetical protein FWG55_01140 [Candidatus Bathyarchaeota archaeon]|nr:hypothetical protein [Candidatus Termiticorpusculum sp.]
MSKKLILALEVGTLVASITNTLCNVMAEETPVYVPIIVGAAAFMLTLLLL